VSTQRRWPVADLRRALAVYVLTDRACARGRSEVDLAAAALAGGATALQLRDKDRPARELYALACALAELCATAAVLFVVNDRLDIALACGAPGVHLGQDDLPVERARALGGPDLVIGVSAGTPREAVAAWRAGADYLGVGPAFATATKPDAGTPLGRTGLASVVRAAPLPVVAIGGIRPENAAVALAAGACGVAAISAVMAATDVAAQASRLASAVRGALA